MRLQRNSKDAQHLTLAVPAGLYLIDVPDDLAAQFLTNGWKPASAATAPKPAPTLAADQPPADVAPAPSEAPKPKPARKPATDTKD